MLGKGRGCWKRLDTTHPGTGHLDSQEGYNSQAGVVGRYQLACVKLVSINIRVLLIGMIGRYQTGCVCGNLPMSVSDECD